MGNVTAEMVKELREKTGVGMGKCKEALVASQGDMEEAVDYLRKAGIAAGVKKEGREAKEGLILFREEKGQIILAEANTETDFVAQNERFHSFLRDVVEQASLQAPSSLEEFLSRPYEKDPSITLDQYRNLVIQALGENIQLRRLEVISKKKGHSYGVYSHMGGKLVVVVELKGSEEESQTAKEIAMHVAAEHPLYLSPKDVPSETIEREKEIARFQIEGKPPQMVEKILEGKLKGYYEQSCLVSQKFIKDPSLTVSAYLESVGKKLSASLSVESFLRWKVGQ